jgi:hypothetical protein
MFFKEPKFQSAIQWFEIPATDMDRAVNFYTKVLDIEIQKGEFMGETQGFFPAGRKGVGGAIVQTDRLAPSSSGPLFYLSVGKAQNLDRILERTEPNGGKTVMAKTAVEDSGFIGVIQDSEGNRIGLHAL